MWFNRKFQFVNLVRTGALQCYWSVFVYFSTINLKQKLVHLKSGGLVLNDSCYKWRYAISKTNEELYNSKNTWKIYEDTTLYYTTYIIGQFTL